MNIAMLTTWNSACGIAEYSRNLVKEFGKLGHHVLVLSNHEYTVPVVECQKVFGVAWWGEDPKFDYQKAWDAINEYEHLHGPIDVLHIQYQSSLYEPRGFNQFLKNIKCKVFVTFHDSTLNMKHIFPDSMISIVHNPAIEAEFFIRFPTIERTPVVFSFGMGRNDYDFIEKACTEIGIHFWGHDSRKAGWWDEAKLFYAMNSADAIVLWYNDVPLQGQSAALRTAISSYRPVIVNNVGWFADAPHFVKKARNINELQILLSETLHLEYVRDNSFENCAKKHIKIYKGEE
jgi:hypothetical protein